MAFSASIHDTSAPILYHQTLKMFKQHYLLGDSIKTGTSITAVKGKMVTPKPRFPQVSVALTRGANCQDTVNSGRTRQKNFTVFAYVKSLADSPGPMSGLLRGGGACVCGAIEVALGKKIKHFWLLEEATLRRKTALVKLYVAELPRLSMSVNRSQ